MIFDNKMTMAPVTEQQKPSEPPEHQKQQFGRVILMISNSVLPQEKLSPTPSSIDGMTAETETDMRNIGCNMIQTAGKLLRLPQVAMATSCVLFQRFFYSKSYVRYSFEHVAMACVCLASKIEESPRRPRDVINVFTHIKQVRQGRPIKPVVLDPEYIRLKNDIIKAERRVLKELGFCVHIKHPHKLIVMYLQLLSFESNHKFTQMSWNFMNDSLRTDCFVRHQPETVACACIYLSARKLNIPLPRKPYSWYELLGVDEDDIKECCYKIICLYQRKSVKQEELEKTVDKLKQIHDDKKKENKLLTGLTAVNSPASQPSSPHSKKDRKDDDRSRSRSLDRKKKKKTYKKERSPSSERDRSRDRKKLTKGGKRERDWSHSPIHKSRKNRSRSREKVSDRYRNERRSEKSDKSYSEKYKKGERLDRDYYRR